MKKLFTILLTLVFMMSMGSAVFATYVTEPSKADGFVDMSPIRIDKVLTINNEGTISPAETFNFTIGGGSGVDGSGAEIDAPPFTDDSFSIDIAQATPTDLGEVKGYIDDIALPDFTQVGVYTYPVTEDPGVTAGMNYDGNTYYLVVTVINNPDFDPLDAEETDPEFLRVLTFITGLDVKTDVFDNTFDAGDLTVTKTVTGNYGDPNDLFEVTVTLTPTNGRTLVDDAIVALGNTTYSQNLTTSVVTITYLLSHEGSFTIENIPYDVVWTVEETDSGVDYEVTYSVDGAEEVDTVPYADMDYATFSVEIINNRDTTVDTGISLDSLPYILLLIAAVAGMGVLVLKKRKHTDF